MDDGFSVFDKIKNTPAYWKTAKYEMLAKLENQGPFQFFFTLSCEDLRWSENFSSILADKDVSICYQFANDGDEETHVKVSEEKLLPLKEYLESYVSESQHELIRTNVLNASRNYNHGVKAFIKSIVMDKSSPMSVQYYSTKVEFQGRGAAHNHGVLWVNFDRVEYAFKNQNGQLCFMEDILSSLAEHIVSIADVEKLLKGLTECKTEKKNFQAENFLIDEPLRNLLVNQLNYPADTDLTQSDILSKFPFYGISSAFKKFQNLERLDEHEEMAVINFANKFTTCTVSPAMIKQMTDHSVLKEKSEKVLDIVKAVNIHNHSRTCRKYDTSCRFGFGKYPIWETLITKPANLYSKVSLNKFTALLKDVRKVLDDEEAIQSIFNSYDKESESLSEYEIIRKERIIKALKKAGLNTPDEYDLYKSALQVSKSGYTVVLKRDIDEMFVNSYNPEWARAWNGNHDLQICLDYFAIIT